jgi:hypothetical protein
MQTADVLRAMLMYVVLPLWLAAGFADYLCHRAAHIERTSGWKESALHILQLAEMALPVLAALLLDINAGVILMMIACLILHHATAMWDVSYASATREIKPIEQHVHSVLEMLPLMGLLIVIALYFDQFAALFGAGEARFEIRLKSDPLPWPYLIAVLGLVLLFEVLPYLEELVRTLRQRNASAERGISRL